MNRALAALLAVSALAPSSAWAGDLFSSIDAVASELKAPDAARRRDAVDKLDAWPGDEARSLLLVALGDADADVRAHAAASIGRHHLIEAVPKLVGALGDPDAHLRASAAEALGALLGGPGASEPTKDAVRAVDTLERALGDGEHEVREARWSRSDACRRSSASARRWRSPAGSTTKRRACGSARPRCSDACARRARWCRSWRGSPTRRARCVRRRSMRWRRLATRARCRQSCAC